MKYKLLFIDTETTGNTAEDILCQISFKYLDQPYDEIFDELYNPGKPIPPEASAVHHISNAMIADKPTFQQSDTYEIVKQTIENTDTIFIAHNAPFDIAMLVKENINAPTYTIDTLRVARHMDPDGTLPRYNLQYIRYALNLDDDIDVPVSAHDAKGDIIVLEQLFKRLWVKVQQTFTIDADTAIEKMIEQSNTPVAFITFTFGKHIGKQIVDVATSDPGYLKWLLAQKQSSDQNEEDWIYTLESALGIAPQQKLL